MHPLKKVVFWVVCFQSACRRYHLMKLNDIKCKNAKSFEPPTKSPRKLADGEGLYMWVMPNGKKYWRLKYKINGKPKELAIGVYPEVSLKEARDKKTAARKLLAWSTPIF